MTDLEELFATEFNKSIEDYYIQVNIIDALIVWRKLSKFIFSQIHPQESRVFRIAGIFFDSKF
jgi:hypothetical protein